MDSIDIMYLARSVQLLFWAAPEFLIGKNSVDGEWGAARNAENVLDVPVSKKGRRCG